MTETCYCGHVYDEHTDHDANYPGDTSCTIDGCGCIAYEEDPGDDD